MDTFLERIIRRVVSQIEANAFRYRDMFVKPGWKAEDNGCDSRY